MNVQQNMGTNTDNYVYDGMNAVQSQSSMSGNVDILSGLWLDDWFASTDSTASVALLRNALGSTIALVNSSGSLATQESYEPFGKTSTSGSSTTNPYAFAGRELDSTGLYFMRARYYNPLLSRFISSDPIGLGGGQPNFFAYAFNNPMNLVDPTGLVGGPSNAPPPQAPPFWVYGPCDAAGGICISSGPNLVQIQGLPQLAQLEGSNTLVIPQQTMVPTPAATPASENLSWEQVELEATYMEQQGASAAEVKAYLEAKGVSQDWARAAAYHTSRGPSRSTPFGWTGPTPEPLVRPTPPAP